MPEPAAVAAPGPTPGDSTRTHLAAALGTSVLTTGMLLGTPAAGAQASAHPVSTFDVTLGNTYTRGTITWHDRAVTVAGAQKSVDPANRRQTTAYSLDIHNKQLGYAVTPGIACGKTQDFSFPAYSGVPGGAAVVRICLDDGTKALLCKRYGRP
ncbi:hypothetical protein [Streptomyces sp. NPDC014734]|uniref:hypothetical protein n=1 Tax=Streptomyces sp. NPDC014734 TaxID=3364886 RepID=UPI0037014816